MEPGGTVAHHGICEEIALAAKPSPRNPAAEAALHRMAAVRFGSVRFGSVGKEGSSRGSRFAGFAVRAVRKKSGSRGSRFARFANAALNC